MTVTLNLIWKPYADLIFGPAYELVGLPANSDDWSASAHRRTCNDGVSYFAHAYINGRYMSHNAKTMQTAIKRLNTEIDRRSIGLFGVDDIAFEVRKS